jgi:FAD binding domain-containing protein
VPGHHQECRGDIHGSAIVVGASLAGLMSALALSRIGLDVTVLERASRKRRSGAALPVSDGLLERLTGRRAHRRGSAIPSGAQAWADVHAALSSAASVVRRHVLPEAPDATFSGYLIWLGLIDEKEILSRPWPSDLAMHQRRTPSPSPTPSQTPQTCTDRSNSTDSFAAGLARYQAARLEAARQLVRSGQSFSRSFGPHGATQ